MLLVLSRLFTEANGILSTVHLTAVAFHVNFVEQSVSIQRAAMQDEVGKVMSWRRLVRAAMLSLLARRVAVHACVCDSSD